MAQAMHQNDSTAKTLIVGVANRGGVISNDWIEILRDALAQGGWLGRTRFLGVLDAAALRRAYGEAGCLLLTSAWETGPLVVWEAMAAGLPVVSAAYTGSGCTRRRSVRFCHDHRTTAGST